MMTSNYSYLALKKIQSKNSKAIIIDNIDVLDYDLTSNFIYDYKIHDVQSLVDNSFIKLIGPYNISPSDNRGYIKYYFAKILPLGIDYIEKYERERTGTITIPILALVLSFIAIIISIIAILQ